MKNIFVTLLLSVGLLAGGDLPEIEPVEYMEVETIQPSPFYVGAGIGIDEEAGRYYDYYDPYSDYEYKNGYTNLSVLAGAVIAREGSLGLAVEGRASWSFDDYGVDSWGVYVKPEFDSDKGFTVFGILGYQELTQYEYTYDATGIGVGGVFLFNDNVGVMVDYIYSYIAEDEYGFTPSYGNLTGSLIYKF